MQQTRTISHTLRTCKQRAGPQQASGAHGALPPGQPVITLAVEGSVGLAKSSGIVPGLVRQWGLADGESQEAMPRQLLSNTSSRIWTSGPQLLQSAAKAVAQNLVLF